MFLIKLEPFADRRGEFVRAFCEKEFEKAGIHPTFCQANVSKNPHAHTFRGFHYQLPPHGESKLVRCESGSIYDVAIDMRPNSPSYLQWFGATLDAKSSSMLFVPKGCAHAFLTLEPQTNVFYMVSEFYTPSAENGLRYNDPHFDIKWPAPIDVISDKDRLWPDFDASAHAQKWTA